LQRKTLIVERADVVRGEDLRPVISLHRRAVLLFRTLVIAPLRSQVCTEA
jgi:hypothetical protein